MASDPNHFHIPQPPNTQKQKFSDGKYISIFDGNYTMHQALTNPRKYFAEITEACYGINDHYPFIRFELREYFPDDYTAIINACGGEPKK